MADIIIRPFDPMDASAAVWAAYHVFRRARAAEDEPGEPIETDAEFEYNMRRSWPLYENRRIHAWDGDAMVGVIGFGFRRQGTPDYEQFAPYLSAWGGVLRPWRRRGIASDLLKELPPFMAERDKTVATLWARQPEGHAFLKAIGAELKHQGVENRLAIAGLDWDELARWRDRIAGLGLTWEAHSPRIPDARLQAMIPEVNVLFQDVPIGSLEAPPLRWELAGMRAYYEELDRHGGAHNLIMLIADGKIAAMCEASFDARYPDRVYQNLTAVARHWRGKGLAKAVKAAMLHHIRERHPYAEIMITGNANINAPMLAINRALGFKEHKRDDAYEIGPDAVRRYLAGRGAST